MTLDMDDPKWTAYVLGELEPAERAEIERELAGSPEATAYVLSLRETVRAIEGELHAQPAPALDELQRKRIQNAAVAPPRSRKRWWIVGGAATAAAASVVVLLALPNNAAMDRSQAPVHAEFEAMGSSSVSDGERELLGHETPKPEKMANRLSDGVKGNSKFRGDAHGGRTHDARIQTVPSVNGQGQYGQAPDPGVGVPHNTEAYDRIDDHPFARTDKEPLSTFSIDVDTASYSNVRRFLTEGQRPPKDAVRIEEMINYFEYDYPAPSANEPFSITTEVGPSPWNAKHKLVRIGLHTAEIADAQVPARNLVFLIDVSGSMAPADRLPLLLKSLELLVETLRPQDKLSIVVYAGAAGLVLPPTSGKNKEAIMLALANLRAGGSTHGSAGIKLAYETAAQTFVKGGINRVILCSDGDYNVGITNQGDLTRLIERERERGVFLTVLGFGRGNFKDAMMEKLADRGNGNYAYIDSLFEAQKVLVQQAGATLVAVAKDVKLQVEFNPATVAGYRLIGYENRKLAAQDFNDDKKDAGEIGAGHSVTALYEVIPAGVGVPASANVDDLKYQTKTQPTGTAGELMTVKVRYKAPTGSTSKLLSRIVETEGAQTKLDDTSVDFRWATAIAAFGMLLRDSPHRGNVTWQHVHAMAQGALGADTSGYRKQAVELISAAMALKP